VQNLLSSSLIFGNIKGKIYRTVILPVLCGWEAWHVTLREVHRLRVFENRVLRKIFGPKMDEVIGEWGRLCNEEFYTNLYFNWWWTLRAPETYSKNWEIRCCGVHVGKD
jgi:hypothetical protein